MNKGRYNESIYNALKLGFLLNLKKSKYEVDYKPKTS